MFNQKIEDGKIWERMTKNRVHCTLKRTLKLRAKKYITDEEAASVHPKAALRGSM